MTSAPVSKGCCSCVILCLQNRERQGKEGTKNVKEEAIKGEETARENDEKREARGKDGKIMDGEGEGKKKLYKAATGCKLKGGR